MFTIMHFSKSRFKAFLWGIGRIFDFAGYYSPHPPFEPPQIADYKALAEDWKRVGDDLYCAIRILEDELYGAREKSR